MIILATELEVAQDDGDFCTSDEEDDEDEAEEPEEVVELMQPHRGEDEI